MGGGGGAQHPFGGPTERENGAPLPGAAWEVSVWLVGRLASGCNWTLERMVISSLYSWVN